MVDSFLARLYYTNSLAIAEAFNIKHALVTKIIKTVSELIQGISKEFRKVFYKDKKGNQRTMYYVSNDGFTLLFNGGEFNDNYGLDAG